MPPEIVINREVFLELRSKAGFVFNLEARLPDQVFNSANPAFPFEYGYVTRAEFGGALKKIGHEFGDEEIYYISLQPDAENDYKTHVGFFGAAIFSQDNIEKRYFPVMSNGGSGNSFLVWGGDIGVFWGKSGRWGIFTDRITTDIAIFSGEKNVSILDIVNISLGHRRLSRHLASQFPFDPELARSMTTRMEGNYIIDNEESSLDIHIKHD